MNLQVASVAGTTVAPAKKNVVKVSANNAKVDNKKDSKTTAKVEKVTPKVTTKPAKEVEKVESFYGTGVEILCTNPEMSFEDLMKKMAKKGFDTEIGKGAIRTAYSQVRKVVSHLRENNLMK